MNFTKTEIIAGAVMLLVILIITTWYFNNRGYRKRMKPIWLFEDNLELVLKYGKHIAEGLVKEKDKVKFENALLEIKGVLNNSVLGKYVNLAYDEDLQGIRVSWASRFSYKKFVCVFDEDNLDVLVNIVYGRPHTKYKYLRQLESENHLLGSYSNCLVEVEVLDVEGDFALVKFISGLYLYDFTFAVPLRDLTNGGYKPVDTIPVVMNHKGIILGETVVPVDEKHVFRLK